MPRKVESRLVPLKALYLDFLMTVSPGSGSNSGAIWLRGLDSRMTSPHQRPIIPGSSFSTRAWRVKITGSFIFRYVSMRPAMLGMMASDAGVAACDSPSVKKRCVSMTRRAERSGLKTNLFLALQYLSSSTSQAFAFSSILSTVTYSSFVIWPVVFFEIISPYGFLVFGAGNLKHCSHQSACG